MCRVGGGFTAEARAGGREFSISISISRLYLPPACECVEVEGDEGDCDDVGVGVDAVLPVVGTGGDEKRAKEGGDLAVGEVAHDAVNAEGGDCSGCYADEVHSPCGCAKWNQRLVQFADEGDEGVARWMGDTEGVGDVGVFGRITKDGGLCQGGEVEGWDQCQHKRGELSHSADCTLPI